MSAGSVTVDPPASLPVSHLSVSSISLLAKCPEKWQRRYLQREYEPPSGKMILGSAAGAAAGQHYSRVVETGEGLSTEAVLDEFSDEWEDRVSREEVAWGGDNPGELKDSGARALEAYHLGVAPQVVPVSVEREFTLSWPGVDWRFTGFLDLETVEGAVADLKMRGRSLSSAEAAKDLQPSAYLYARRAEDRPADRFEFHAMVRAARPYARVVSTVRSDRQLDLFVARVFQAAAEIDWRVERDAWSGAPPGAWWCGERACGYWQSCPWGGLR